MKILFVGFGSIAKKHLWALNQIRNDLELFALRSSADAPLIDGVKSIYQMSEVPNDIAFAIISNPTSAHAGTILIVSKLGCPIFIEKPVFNEINDGNRALAQQLNAVGLKTYVACNLRFHPLMIVFKDLVYKTKSRIEEVNVYCGSYLPDWRPGTDYLKSYSSNRELGGGVDLDLIHEIDYVTWFFGFPTSALVVKNSNSSINIQAPDAAYYILKYNNFVANIALNYFRKKPQRTFEVVLSDQILKLDLINNCIYKDHEVIVKGDENDMMSSYIDQMKYFIQCVESNGAIENDIQNGLKVLEICLINELKR